MSTLGAASCASDNPKGPSLQPTARPASVQDVPGAKPEAVCSAQVKHLGVTVVSTLNDNVRSAKKYFQKIHPGLTVDVSASASNYTQVVQQVAADQAGGRQVDVAVAGFDELPTFVRALGARAIPETILRKSYDRSFLPLGEAGGKLFAVPQQVSVPILIYNRDLLDAAGVSPNSLSTTDGLLRAAAALHRRFPAILPVDLPTTEDSYGQWLLDTVAASKSAGIQDSSGRPNLTSPDVQAAASFLGKVATYGPQSTQIIPALVRFGIGRRSAIVGGSIGAVSAGLQALSTQKGAKLRIGLLPFPMLPGGVRRSVAEGNGLVILSKSKCQEELAREFIAALLSPDVVAAGVESVSYLPVDRDAAGMLKSFYAQYPVLAPFRNAGKSLVKAPYWSGSRGGEVPALITTEVEKIEHGADVKRTLDHANSEVTALTR